MFLNINDYYECLNYIIHFINLIKTTEEELIHFDKRDF